MAMYMVDPFSYPQGDVQKWMEGSGERIAEKVPDHVAKLIARGLGNAHAVAWTRPTSELMQLRSAMIAGLIPADESLLVANPELRIRDRGSGMLYQPTDPLTFDPGTMSGEENQLLKAATLRYLLQKQSGRTPLDSHPTFVMAGNPSVMSTPIADYEAATLDDCRRILNELDDVLVTRARVKRLWLRGQTSEHRYDRPKEVRDWFRFGYEDAQFPSLVPSLGRFALRNPGAVDLKYAFGGPSHWWKKPFLVWVIRQNPGWLDHYPEFRKRLDESLASSDDKLFTKILIDIQLDPHVPEEVDDLRQWFFAHYKYSAWVWVLQQYGYLATMLDVMRDLDTALFFTQATMVDGRFTLPDPTEERVIYVFAQTSDSEIFWDTETTDWGDADWARKLPPRVVSQRAGCLTGCTWFRQNYYGYLVVARILLTGTRCLTTRTVPEIFPPPDEDLLLRTLIESRPPPEGLYW